MIYDIFAVTNINTVILCLYHIYIQDYPRGLGKICCTALKPIGHGWQGEHSLTATQRQRWCRAAGIWARRALPRWQIADVGGSAPNLNDWIWKQVFRSDSWAGPSSVLLSIALAVKHLYRPLPRMRDESNRPFFLSDNNSHFLVACLFTRCTSNLWRLTLTWAGANSYLWCASSQAASHRLPSFYLRCHAL